jgi:hypothetical protein
MQNFEDGDRIFLFGFSRRLHRARGRIAAAHVRSHPKGQSSARALRNSHADGDLQYRSQGRRSHRRGRATSGSPPISKRRSRPGPANPTSSASGIR